jgi:hypothetical protein
MFRARCQSASTPAPGAALFCADAGSEESVGNVLDAVATGAQSIHLSAVVAFDYAGRYLRLGDAGGPQLQLAPPPYPFPNIEPR